jgi:hypothetical protein
VRLATNITEKKGFPFHKVENEDLILGRFQFALSGPKLWHIGNVLKRKNQFHRPQTKSHLQVAEKSAPSYAFSL